MQNKHIFRSNTAVLFNSCSKGWNFDEIMFLFNVYQQYGGSVIGCIYIKLPLLACLSWLYYFRNDGCSNEQDRQWTYNGTLRFLRAAIFAVEKQ
jgi:hypothetical protein